jgi:YD repeat-containing protein
MSLHLSLAPGTLKKSTLRSLAIIVDRPTAFLLIVAIFFSGVLITLPQSVQATGSQEKPISSAPPEPFIIHSPAVATVVGSTVANFVSTVTSLFFRPTAVPDGLTGMRIGSESSAQPLRVERPTLDSSHNIDQSENSLAPPFSVPAAVVDFDFDGDGKADYGRWHSANFQYKVTKSGSSGYDTFTIGNSSSGRVAPGDFDGDGKTDAGIFSAGIWKYKTSPTASETSVTLGQSGDIPAAGDYDGDGKTDQAVFRPSTGTWLVRISSAGSCPSGYSGTAPNCSVGFGSNGDIPVPGDYDGDSKSDPAVFRAGTWYVLGSQAGYYGIQWGLTSDIPVPANYDTDSITDMAVFRPSSGTWYVLTSSSPGNYFSANWGNWGDQPTPADYDGDGKADLCIWRPSTGVWWMLRSSNGTYETVALGVNGDFAVPSAYLRQSAADVASDDLAAARLSPRNAIGGTDLYSQNFSWNTELVSLPGRSGLDLNIGLSYNSLVWTKVGNAMVFDSDYSNVSPGFRIGFPVIEPVYYDGTKEKYAYMMVAPSGARVEFRQTTVSNIYETGDSSYSQLVTSNASDPNDPVDNITIKVTTTDGTQMTYTWNYGEFRCTQIKDRNGNYISASYDGNGRLGTITDTLSRVLTVNYNIDGHPESITQTWKDDNGHGANTTHNWATFTYTTKNVAFDFADSLAIAGPPNGLGINVLEKVTYADGSSTKFTYNDYLQVYKVENVAADSSTHILNYMRTNLQSPSANQTDCPRFTDTYNWAENFAPTGVNGSNETHIANSAPANTTYNLPSNISGSASIVDIALENHPNGLHTRIYYGSSGWQEGLQVATEDCVSSGCNGSDRKRWTYAYFTQDDTAKSYPVNPRVLETRVGDGINTKKTNYSYYEYLETTIAKYGLVSEISVYDNDLTTVLKTINYSYNFDSAYIDRRIIGLPASTSVWGLDQKTSSFGLVSHVSYEYDQGNFGDSSLNQNISPTHHDDENYGSSFTAGRGNQTSITRWDVTQPSNSGLAVTSTVKYNTAGSVVAQITPWNGTNTRTTRIGYADVWNDNVSRSTYAYPTTLTDPAGSSLGASGHTSTIKYRYDIGTNVRAQSPATDGNSTGKTTERTFDAQGRLQKELIVNTGAYTRYEYPSNSVQSKVYSTIIDINDNNTGDSADEVSTESWTDGAGHVRRSRTEHPGSTGGWSATFVEYDVLGRMNRQSLPTEVDSNWSAAGDDQAGFLWKYQKYDWKGRVVRTINSDGVDSTTPNDSDVLISYDGCGCAGGQVTTVLSELVPRTDSTGGYARRKQKIYEDIQGRQYKSEAFDWDGSTVYSTTVAKFNGRDQVLESTQYAGTASTSNEHQVTTLTYDGHGRISSQHIPQQSENADTSFQYNEDDSVSVKTDGRGATSVMTYNDQGLVTQIENVMPTPTPTPTPTPSPTPPPTTTSIYSPIGFLDGSNDENATVNGWSLDPDNAYMSNTVHFYIGGPAGTGTYVGETVADKPRPDVNTNTGYPGNHGFEFSIPSQYLDGQDHTIYAYGIDTGSNGSTHLSASPKTFRMLTPLAPPPTNTTIAFSYDSLGNRILMTDSSGNVAYEYDELSRLTSETRQFNDTLANSPLPNNKFKLEYTYGLSGSLKSLKDPYGQTINYGYDDVGRLSSVTGSTFGGITEYADQAQYRAWGGLKGLDYGNGVSMSETFNNRLLPNHYELVKDTTEIIKKNYNYLSDGRLNYLQDQLDDKFDRLNIYDSQGRIQQGKTGLEARGGAVPDSQQGTNLPYRQSYQFNAFSNMTQRNNRHWGVETWHGQSNNLSYTYQNNRITGDGWSYDADGRATEAPEENATSTYDARGLLTVYHTIPYSIWNTWEQSIIRRFYSGDGREVKRLKRTFHEDLNQTTPPYGNWSEEDPIYYIRSSVLGGEVISEVEGTGRKKQTFVFAAGAKIAAQSQYTYNNNTTQSVNWEQYDASGMSYRATMNNGSVAAGSGQFEGAPAEMDPLGGNVGLETPYVEDPVIEPPPADDRLPYFPLPFEDMAYVDGRRVPCTLDGVTVGCSMAMSLLEHGSALPAGLAPYQGIQGFRFDSFGLGIFTATIPTGLFRMDPIRPITMTVSFSVNIGNVSWINHQAPRLTPLEPNKAAALNNAYQELINRLKQGKVSKDCQQNVIDKLNSLDGFSLDKFIAFLEGGGNFYDGEQSTVPVADYDVLGAPSGGWTITVAQRFALPGRDLHAFTANGPKVTQFTVFFDPDRVETKEKVSQISGQKVSGLTTSNLAFFFHEGLHGYGNAIGKLSGPKGFGDEAIQNALDLPTGGGGSKNISDYVEQNCFK